MSFETAIVIMGSTGSSNTQALDSPIHRRFRLAVFRCGLLLHEMMQGLECNYTTGFTKHDIGNSFETMPDYAAPAKPCQLGACYTTSYGDFEVTVLVICCPSGQKMPRKRTRRNSPEPQIQT